jgi:transposase-like protein
MSMTDLTDKQRAALAKRIESLRKIAGVESIRALVDMILDVTNSPKRVVITHTMDVVIVERTLAGETAAQIAKRLDISEPTVAAARRRLGLTKRYAPRAKLMTAAEGQAATDAAIESLQMPPPEAQAAELEARAMLEAIPQRAIVSDHA